LLAWRFSTGAGLRTPNQFVITLFVPRRCGKKEGTFDLRALAPAIHIGEKFRKKWLDNVRI
jgi:hypothetical protein